MALSTLTRFSLVWRTNPSFIRYLKLHFLQKNASTSVVLLNSGKSFDFSKHKAAKLSFSENLGLLKGESDRPKEENDLDEILKGNKEYKSDYANYIDLKLKLFYCEKNGFPTEALRAELEPYEKRLEKRFLSK